MTEPIFPPELTDGLEWPDGVDHARRLALVEGTFALLLSRYLGEAIDDDDDDDDVHVHVPIDNEMRVADFLAAMANAHRAAGFVAPGLSEAARRHMREAFPRVLKALAGSPEARLGEIDVLSPAERHRILEGFNLPRFPPPNPPPLELITAGFARQVVARPNAIAVHADGDDVSFVELDRRAKRLAQALVAQGAGPGKVVAVCVERGVGLIVALLGVLEAGAAYVPLDPAYPRDRIVRMLDTASVSLAVTEAHLQHLVDVPSVRLERGHCTYSPSHSPNLAGTRPTTPTNAGPHDVCYVMFTSGSTGEPKGVVMTHHAVANTLKWVNDRLGVATGDRALFVTSPSFDLSVYDIFGILGAGATLVIASAAVLEDPAELARAVDRYGITLWNSTPAAFAQVVPFLSPGQACATLRWVLLSGDWIPLPLAQEMSTSFPRTGLLALGGATEAAIWSNAFEVDRVDPAWRSIPYGRPLVHMRYHVLDGRQQPVPVGVAGELYIGGVGLAKGYANRPDLTAERFIADPFRPGERLYRTGDRARYHDDGIIELLGRIDRQVKIRGFRVELAEVEGALATCTGVQQAVCVVRTDGSGQQSLTAYVVARPETAREPEALREELGRTLPAYLVPDKVVMCARLPLSPQGKVDLRALADSRDVAPVREPVAPRNAREAEMLAIWKELLHTDNFGVEDTFASLGGHSLLVVKLVTAIRQRFGIGLSVSALMEHPTIASLVSHLFSSNRGPSFAGGLPASPRAGLSTRRAPHLFALQEGGSRPPLVLIAGVGGFAFTYRNLPQLFGPEQPIYAFQSVGAEREEPLEALSLEQIAAIYQRELAALPGTGPLVLGGFSFGALPAFELARRLMNDGRRVPLLVSLDGFAPGFPRKHAFSRRLEEHARNVLEACDSVERRRYLMTRLQKLKDRLLRAVGKEALLAADLPVDPALNERLKQLWVLHTRAARAYRPAGPAHTSLLLIRVENPEPWPGTDADDSLFGWRRHITGSLALATIPTSHTALLESAANQKVCATIISRHIDAVVAAQITAPH